MGTETDTQALVERLRRLAGEMERFLGPPEMAPGPDPDDLTDAAALIASLQKKLAERTAERDEALKPSAIADAKPAGWFNPWDDYHGYQQVAKKYEGKPHTIALYPWSELSRFVAERDAAEARADALAQEVERLAAALKTASKALRPFYDAVFNDNGDMTVSGPYDYEEAVAGYFAYGKINDALEAKP